MQRTDYPANLLKLNTIEKLRAELCQNKQMKEKATVCSVINVVSDFQIMADPNPVAIIVSTSFSGCRKRIGKRKKFNQNCN